MQAIEDEKVVRLEVVEEEPLTTPGPVREGMKIRKHLGPNQASVAGDESYATTARHGRLVLFERPHKCLQIFVVTEVVVREPGEQLRLGLAQHATEIVEGTDVCRVPYDAKPRIRGGIPAQDIAGSVRRRVVCRDDLEVAERLSEQGVERGCQEPLSVEDRQPDADARREAGAAGHREHPTSRPRLLPPAAPRPRPLSVR